MLLNKKTMAAAICLLTIFSFLLSGCELEGVSSEIPGVINPEVGVRGGFYIDGELTELVEPDRESAAYKSFDDTQKHIYSAAYTALCADHTEFRLTGVKYKTFMEEYGDVLTIFLNDYPEFFWLDGYVEINADYMMGSEIGNVTIIFGVFDHWKSADLESAKARLDSALDQLVGEASAKPDDYSKVKYVHDYIIKNTEYDYDSYYAGETIDAESNASVNTAYGPLVEGRAMCGGYARAFEIVMHKLGIEANYITGDADGGPHAWNAIKLGDEYYYIDLTWDDTDGEPCEIIYYYFCLTEEELEKTHTIDAENPDIEAVSTECNYYVKEGLYLAEYDFDILNSLWQETERDGMLTVRFESTAEMDRAYDDLIRSDNISKLDAMSESYSYQYMMSNEFNILTILYD